MTIKYFSTLIDAYTLQNKLIIRYIFYKPSSHLYARTQSICTNSTIIIKKDCTESKVARFPLHPPWGQYIFLKPLSKMIREEE